MAAPTSVASASPVSSYNNGAAPTEGSSPQVHKKRRIPNACDICKKKKSQYSEPEMCLYLRLALVRCDSAEMPNNRCSNCIQLGIECTHQEVRKVSRIGFDNELTSYYYYWWIGVRDCEKVRRSSPWTFGDDERPD